MSIKFHLEYGVKSVWLIRWKDNNCNRNWISFFGRTAQDADIVIKEHCNHEGFEIHIVEVLAEKIK